jgi:hypothetical protein
MHFVPLLVVISFEEEPYSNWWDLQIGGVAMRAATKKN